MLYQGKYLVFLHSKNFPKLTWTYSVAAIPDIVFLRWYQIGTIITHKVSGASVAPALFGPSPSMNTALEVYLWAFSHCYSPVPSHLNLRKRSKVPASSCSAWSERRHLEFITHFDSTLLPFNIVLHKNSQFILAALQGLFSAWMPRSLFFPLSLVGVQE